MFCAPIFFNALLFQTVHNFIFVQRFLGRHAEENAQFMPKKGGGGVISRVLA